MCTPQYSHVFKLHAIVCTCMSQTKYMFTCTPSESTSMMEINMHCLQ